MLYRTHVLAPLLATIFFLLFTALALTDTPGYYVSPLSAGLMLIACALAMLIGLGSALGTHHPKRKKALYGLGEALFFSGLLSFMILGAPSAVNAAGLPLIISGLVVTLISAWLMRNPH